MEPFMRKRTPGAQTDCQRIAGFAPRPRGRRALVEPPPQESAAVCLPEPLQGLGHAVTIPRAGTNSRTFRNPEA